VFSGCDLWSSSKTTLLHWHLPVISSFSGLSLYEKKVQSTVTVRAISQASTRREYSPVSTLCEYSLRVLTGEYSQRVLACEYCLRVLSRQVPFALMRVNSRCGNCLCAIFLPRCMECRRGLAMRILSVCLSVCPSVCLSHACIVTKR